MAMVRIVEGLISMPVRRMKFMIGYLYPVMNYGSIFRNLNLNLNLNRQYNRLTCLPLPILAIFI